MPAMLFLMLQSTAPAPAVPPTALPDRLSVSKACSPGASDEIVVCGAKDAALRYRLPPLDATRYQEHPVRAERRLLGNVTGSIELEQAQLASGIQSKRVMARLKLPF